jgi:hypothetical protein
MGNEVYANGREISCKAADGKSICAFPDVCFTPPQTPATPPGVPIPYPNTGMASDTTEGSKSVKISGKEVMLKNKSYFKKSTGDEAGCAPKKGIITSKNMGKVYFSSWSPDVKFEGENVVRHLDLTTHNHASANANEGIPWPHIDSMALAPMSQEECKKKEKEADDACKDSNLEPKGKGNIRVNCSDDCKKKQKCTLVDKNKDKTACCSPGNTGHHLVEASAFYDKGRGGKKSTALKGAENYKANSAPCLCIEGVSHHTDNHGIMHTFQSAKALANKGGVLTLTNGKKMEVPHATTYGQAKKNGAIALVMTYPDSQCNINCIISQYDEYDKEHGLKDSMKIKSVKTCNEPDVTEAVQNVEERIRQSNISKGVSVSVR